MINAILKMMSCSVGTSTKDGNLQNRYTIAPTIEDKDIYKYVLDTRNFEISLFWQRSNYFLVLNTALAVGFFKADKDLYAFVLALIGFVTSLLWYRVNLGSKYWQSRWEQKLAMIEREIAPELKCFDTTRAITDQDVRESIASAPESKSKLQKRFESVMLEKKPSVSYNMTLLSVWFMLGWTVLVIARIGDVFKSSNLQSIWLRLVATGDWIHQLLHY